MFSPLKAGLALLHVSFLCAVSGAASFAATAPSSSAGAQPPADGPQAVQQPSAGKTAEPAAETADSTVRAGDFVLRISTTGASLKLALPPLEVDEAVTKSLKRRYGDRGLLQARLRGGEGNLNVVAAYGDVRPSAKWRETLMGSKIVGLGQFSIGDVACTEGSRDLEPPYVDWSWHAFFTMGDTCFDATFQSLANGGQLPFPRAEFEKIVRGARYAYVRLGDWAEMPLPVLDRMHEALAAPADGVARLVELASSAPDGWACALAAAEIGLATGTAPQARRELAEKALAGLPKAGAGTKVEEFARFTAESALALALRDDGKLDEALAALDALEARAAGVGSRALVATQYDRATVFGKKGDAKNAVAVLKGVIEREPDRRSFATHEPCFQPIAQDKALLALLRAPK